MAVNQNSISLPTPKLSSHGFRQFLIMFSTKLDLPGFFNSPEALSSGSDEAKLLAGNVSDDTNLDESGISLLAFPSRTKLKLCNIHVTQSWLRA